MNTEVDFKALWNKEEAKDMPDVGELLKKAASIRKITRTKLIVQSLILLATVIFLLCVGLNIDNKHVITMIGLILMVVAIVSYLVVANQMLPMLFKSDIEGSSQEYLDQLIRIKRKNDFINKVMINVYFSLLCLGILLYSLQFTARMSTGWEVLYYVMTFGWIGFSWFVSRPRGIKRKQQPLLDMIARLEEVNKQLRDSD